MKHILFGNRYLEFRCVQAFFYKELQRAEYIKQQGGGKDCVRNQDIVTDGLINIMSLIEKNNNTYSNIKALANKNTYVKKYYNSIADVVRKHFTVEKPWIPSLLTIEVFRIYTEAGFSDFKDIDFLNILTEYESHKNRKEHKIGLHLKCAEELFLH